MNNRFLKGQSFLCAFVYLRQSMVCYKFFSSFYQFLKYATANGTCYFSVCFTCMKDLKDQNT